MEEVTRAACGKTKKALIGATLVAKAPRGSRPNVSYTQMSVFYYLLLTHF